MKEWSGRRSRPVAAIVAAVMVVSLASVLFASPAGADVSDAEAPEWEEGMGTALEMEFDLLSVYEKNSDEVESSVEGMMENLSEELNITLELEELSMNEGEISAHKLYEIEEETDETVTFASKFAAKALVDGAASFGMKGAPAAGQYDDLEELKGADEEDIDNSVSMDLAMALTQSLRVTHDKETMDIVDLELFVRPTTVIDMHIESLPHMAENEEGIELTYDSLDVDLVNDVGAELALEFVPPFKLMDLPMEEDAEWSTETEEVRISGEVMGSIDLDVSGESPMAQEIEDGVDEALEQINEEFPEVQGLEELPIELDELSVPAAALPDLEDNISGEMLIEDGVLPEQAIEVPEIPMHKTGSNETDLLAIHGLMEENLTVNWFMPVGMPVPGVVEIPFEDMQELPFEHDNCSVYIGGIPYSKSALDIEEWDSALEERAEDVEMMVVLMAYHEGLSIAEEFSFETVSPASAQDSFEAVQSEQEALFEEPEEEDPGLIEELFLEPPYYGAIGAAAIILGLAALFLIRRG